MFLGDVPISRGIFSGHFRSDFYFPPPLFQVLIAPLSAPKAGRNFIPHFFPPLAKIPSHFFRAAFPPPPLPFITPRKELNPKHFPASHQEGRGGRFQSRKIWNFNGIYSMILLFWNIILVLVWFQLSCEEFSRLLGWILGEKFFPQRVVGIPREFPMFPHLQGRLDRVGLVSSKPNLPGILWFI